MLKFWPIGQHNNFFFHAVANNRWMDNIKIQYYVFLKKNKTLKTKIIHLKIALLQVNFTSDNFILTWAKYYI